MALSLEQAYVKILLGEVVAFPTETLFGLGANPKDERAVTQLLALKSRRVGQGVPMIIDSAEYLDDWCDEDDAARDVRNQLVARFWPGPLTIVLRLSKFGKREISRGIWGDDETIAVRCSPHRIAAALATGVGGALCATSANPHGVPPARSVEEVTELFPKIPVVDGECGESGMPSTIVRLTRESPVIVREGAIPSEEIFAVLAAGTLLAN